MLSEVGDHQSLVASLKTSQYYTMFKVCNLAHCMPAERLTTYLQSHTAAFLVDHQDGASRLLILGPRAASNSRSVAHANFPP